MDDEVIWKALSDASRRRILDCLRPGPMTTGALSKRFEQTRYGVMKHLKILEQSGLVTSEMRGREKWNFLNGAALTQATSRWLNSFQKEWGTRLHQLTEMIEEDQEMRTMLGLNIKQKTKFSIPREQVFRALTEGIDKWWLSDYRQAGAGSQISIAPEIGGEMIERHESGHAAIWGRVEEISAPKLIYMSGRFAVSGAVAGRVHFDLEDTSSGCELTLTHTAVGDISDDVLSAFSKGWKDLINTGLTEYLSAA